MDKFKRFLFTGEEGEILDWKFPVPKLFSWLAIIYLVIALWTSWIIVYRDQAAVIRMLGSYNRTCGPGFNPKLPWPIETAVKRNTTEARRVEVGFRSKNSDGSEDQESTAETVIKEEAETTTSDMNLVDLYYAMQYYIANVAEWEFGVQDPKLVMGILPQSSMRLVVGNTTFDDVATTGREIVQNSTKVDAQKCVDVLKMGAYVSGIQLMEADPPSDSVKSAFRDIITASENRQTSIQKAEAYRDRELPKVQGDSTRIVQNALGYQAERLGKSIGDSLLFAQVYEEYRKNPEMNKRRLLLECLERVLPDLDQVIDASSGQGNSALKIWRLDDFLKGGGK